MQRRWEIMSERFEKQEQERKKHMKDLERNHKLEMERLEMERLAMEKKLENDSKKIREDKKIIEDHIRRDVERKMRMASDMEKLIIQNNMLKRELKRKESKECIIS